MAEVPIAIRMSTSLMIIYVIAVYAAFLATFLYTIGFVGNVVVLTSIDAGTVAPWSEAVAIDIALLGLFAVQHTVMARRTFKRWWTKIVPEPVERSTYVLAASAALALLMWQWRPIPEPLVWSIENRGASLALTALQWLGWAVVLISTFLIDHFELFGLRQVFERLRGHSMPPPLFRTPLFYKHVRHPIYVGFLLAFWATPTMTAGHFLFAVATTGYILVGIWFEERDLVAQFGEQYRHYRKQVGMLLPWRARSEPRRGVS
jgi:methanethiol S-methyltransferase